MKIGILTQPLVNNYGGILQNFALQQVLKSLGHDPITINFEHKPLKFHPVTFSIGFCKALIKKMLGQSVVSFNPIKADRLTFGVCPHQQRFIEEKINKINRYDAISADDNIVENFDAYVIGSDQVWRPMYSPHMNNMFLDFAHDYAKKIAYAVSFGSDQWEIGPEQTLKYASLAKRFDAISVRESSGVGLCNDFLGVEATHVLDPTMMLDAKVYSDIAGKADDYSYKHVVTYILDKNRDIHKFVDSIALQTRSTQKSLGTSAEPDGQLQSIENWLKGIRDAKCVITDSFHGTVFSIIFHTPFYTLCNSTRGISRIQSLLSLFSLEDRLISSPLDSVVYSDIDWGKVDDKLEELRAHSMDFLIKALDE